MKNLRIIAFSIIALIQLYVPAHLILGREKVIQEGTLFRFESAPVDPTDPFRGKYITLNYKATIYEDADTTIRWQYGQEVFAALENDQKGFATIKEVSLERPDEGPYVQTRLTGYSTYNGKTELFLEFDFNRFYMEESKAYNAEVAYRESLRDSVASTYAEVYILDGDAVVTDVYVNNTPILELLEK